MQGQATELLRFDCFAHNPHYHYGPEHKNERIMLGPTVTGSPLGWSLKQLRTRLPAMLKRAGYEAVAKQVNATVVAQSLDEVETAARQMDGYQGAACRAYRR